MFHQVAGRLGKQHLPSMSRAHVACGTVHVQANVALSRKLWLTCIEADTGTLHPYCC